MDHYVWRAEGRLTSLLDRPARLRAIRALLGTGAPVLAFCAVDNHVHAVLDGANRWQRAAMSKALNSAIGVDGEPSACKPITSRSHLQNVVRYLFTQVSHHDLHAPPALYDGSCFWDLVGARHLAGFDPARLQAHLPRMDRHALAAWLDVSLRLGAVEGRSLPTIVAASRAATGAIGRGKLPHEVRARVLATQAASRAGFALDAVAEALHVSPRSAARWRRRRLDDPWWQAFALQLGLRSSPPRPTRPPPPPERAGARP